MAVNHIEIARDTVQKHRFNAIDCHHHVGAVLIRRAIGGFAGQVNWLVFGIAVAGTSMRQKGCRIKGPERRIEDLHTRL